MQRWLSWSKAHDWKSCILGIVSRVRIPLSAPTKRAPDSGALFVTWNGEGFEGRALAKATVRPLPPPRPSPQARRIPLSAPTDNYLHALVIAILLHTMYYDHGGENMKKALVILFFLVFFVITGCEEDHDEIYQKGYEEGYSHGYSYGYEDGFDNGYQYGIDEAIKIAKNAIEELYGDSFYHDWDKYFSVSFEEYIKDY